MNAQVNALVNHKGGTGKSTNCANLGGGRAQAGKRFSWWTAIHRPALPSA